MKVVLLHGWPLSERMWVSQISAVRRVGLEALAPHLYRRGPTIDGWASQLLRDHDGDFVLVGASMGGYCALAMARRAPERIAGLVLVSSRAEADAFERRRERERRAAILRERGIPSDLETEEDAEDLAAAQEAMRDRMDLSGVVASFEGPLLVCVGNEDELVSVDESRALAASAPRGRLEVFEGAGHFPSLDQAERFNEVLLDFLGEWKT
jgi:pimeloyl-ACP methyl ester carboxylesterase